MWRSQTKIAWAISITIHFIFLSAPASKHISDRENKEEQAIIVNIETEKPTTLPHIDNLGEEKRMKETPGLERVPEVPPKENKVTEMDKVMTEVKGSDSESMLRYQDMIKQRIEEVKRYPSWAKKQGIEGTASVKFNLLSSGISEDIEIISSSGSEILDDEAVSTIKRANPFPPIPKEVGGPKITIEVDIVFQCKTQKGMG